MKSGVYQILNLVNGKRYIGSSINLKFRIWTHKHELKNGKHDNKHLLYSYSKYGKENFDFKILEYCENSELIAIEQFYIDLFGINNLYNNRILANSNKGIKHTEEFKQARRNFRHTEEAKKRIKESAKSRKYGPLPEFRKEQLRKLRLGKDPVNKGKKGLQGKNKTSFSPGIVPWNKNIKTWKPSWNSGTKGICKPNKTSFKKGESVSPKTQFKKGGVPWNAIKFKLVSPDGILYEGAGITSFAKSLGYSREMAKLISEEIKSFKGWTLPKENTQYDKIIKINTA